jgi:predicted RNase H-like HicB family nuclease
MSEYMISMKIEKLEEGGYLATSDSIQGLIAQGRTIAKTMKIAQDVAKKLIESYIDHNDPLPFETDKSINRVTNVQIPVSVEA